MRSLCALVLLVGCATNTDRVQKKRKPSRGIVAAPDPTPAPPLAELEADGGAPEREEGTAIPAAAPDHFGDVGFKEVSEKSWLAGIRKKVSQEQKVDPDELRFSAGRLRVAFVRSGDVGPRRHQIVVVDNQGKKVAAFRPVTAARGDEPPKGLRFLSEDRLIYEVVEPAAGEASLAPNKTATKKAARGRKGKTKGKPTALAAAAPEKPAAPPRLFIIQPITPPGERPVRCKGLHFVLTPQQDRMAFVGGDNGSGFVAVDGEQVYPRRGRTMIYSAPVWSKDGRSLAFLESPADKPARLVLLAELNNPTGDTTWDLPPDTSIEGTRVFWNGSGRLVVGKTASRPVFSAPFSKEAPR